MQDVSNHSGCYRIGYGYAIAVANCFRDCDTVGMRNIGVGKGVIH